MRARLLPDRSSAREGLIAFTSFAGGMRVLDYRNYMDGRFVDGTGAFAAINPRTGQPTAWVHEADASLVDRAVDHAHEAFEQEWGRVGESDRSALLLDIAAAIEAHIDALVSAEVADTGQPEARIAEFDIALASAQFRNCAEALESDSSGERGERSSTHYLARRPFGAVGIFPSWRLPILSLASTLAPVLAAGNTAVVKPASDTPGAATLLATVGADVGLPAGVYNVVHGFDSGPAAGRLGRHPRLRGVLHDGRRPQRRSGPSPSPHQAVTVAVVCADVDVAVVAEKVARSIVFNSGQFDESVDRVYVERAVYGELCVRLTAAIERLRAGVDFGPLISRSHHDTVVQALERTACSGLTLLTERDPSVLPGGLRGGFWLRPTLWAAENLAQARSFERVDGPAGVLVPFDDVNDLDRRVFCDTGRVCASVWTGDVDRGHRIARTMGAETVWVNSWFIDHPRVAQHEEHGRRWTDGPAARIARYTHVTRVFSSSPN